MNNKPFKINSFIFLIPLLTGCLFILIGSFWDLDISLKIANPYNLSGKLSQSFGAILGYLLSPLAGALVYNSLKDSKKVIVKIVSILLVIASVVVPGFIMVKEMKNTTNLEYSFNLPGPLPYLIAYGLVTITFELFYHIFKNYENKRLMFKCGISIALVVIFSIMTHSLIKPTLARPRFRYLKLNDCFDEFLNWWQINKNAPINLTDDFKSCPSGHTATCFTTLSLLVMPQLFPHSKQKKVSVIIFVLCMIYGLIVGLSRVTCGAHFLSDVGIGILIGTLYSYLIPTLIFKFSE